MKQKLFCVLLAGVMAFSGITVAYANDETTTLSSDSQESTTQTQDSTTAQSDDTTQQSEETTKTKEQAQEELEAQQSQLEEDLAAVDEKLEELAQDSKVTQEYIDALDEKIGTLNSQLEVLEESNNNIQEEIDELELLIEENQESLQTLTQEVEQAQKELDELEEKFQSIYEAYCARLKIMYITGEYNILTALFGCSDISSLLTRYQMIKAVAKSDTELLTEVQEKTAEIVTKKDGLDEKQAQLQAVQDELDAQNQTLIQKQNTIEQNRKSIASKKITLANDMAESDELLAELNEQNNEYTEYKYQDEEMMEELEQEIQDLIDGIKTPDEVTTAVASESDEYDSTDDDSDSSSEVVVYYNSDAVLNMCYPVPGYHTISAGFPNYSSGAYHGGMDFPCPLGTKVVAAQKGIVITADYLNYGYGHYVMIYHGTDSKGRKVVTVYGHNTKLLVSVGDTVEKGQQIATSGSTGKSTGPHCHFEVRLNGERVQPKNYLT